MTLSPILDAPLAVQLHLVAAVPAVILGPLVLFRRRVDRRHKVLGYAWITAMACLAISAFFIEAFGPNVMGFGILHLLSVLSLGSLAYGVAMARRGNIAAHRATMTNLWFFGIGGPGILNFLPGRTINRAVFDGASDAGFVVIAAGVIGLIWLWRNQRAAVLGIGV